MKQTFSADIAEESARNAQWEQLEQPTPPPVVIERKSSGGHAARGHGHGLDWDDEELETQIFDRLPGGPDDPPPEPEERTSEELSSADIMLPDVVSIDYPNDDKTAIAPPPDEAQLAFDAGDPMPPPGMGFGGYPGSPPGPGMSMAGGPMPAPGQGMTQPFGQTLLGAAAPLPPGPPPGLSAYRQTGQMPIPNTTVPWGQPMQPPNHGGLAQGGQGGPGYQQGSPFRQTIMGLPQMSPPYAPPAPPPPTGYAEQQASAQPRARFPVAATVAVLALAVVSMVVYNFYNRPGKLEIDVNPEQRHRHPGWGDPEGHSAVQVRTRARCLQAGGACRTGTRRRNVGSRSNRARSRGSGSTCVPRRTPASN